MDRWPPVQRDPDVLALDPSVPSRTLGRQDLVIRHADVKPVPWKNGLGATSQLAIWPPDASMDALDFDWRISVAKVEAAGPFSTFLGFDRILTVTSGLGLRLDHRACAPAAEVRRLKPYFFSGDWPTDARLIGGGVMDFNVIYRRGRVKAEVESVCVAGQHLLHSTSCGHWLLHIVRGTVRVAPNRPGHALVLDAGDSFWCQPADSTELKIEAQGQPADILSASVC